MDLIAHFSDTAFLAKLDRMAVSGHQGIYGGDEGLRHHLCVAHGEHMGEGASREEMEGRHEDEHPSGAGHRGEYSCPDGEHDDREAGEFEDLHEGLGEIHRGIGVNLPDDLHRMVHDQARPRAERSRALLEHVSDHPASPHGGLGTHWTTDNGVAESFAEMSGRWSRDEDDKGRPASDHSFGSYAEENEDDEQPRRYRLPKPGTAVVFHAHEPAREDIDDDPNGRYGNGDVYGHTEHGEREVPVNPGAGLRLRGISWAQVHAEEDPDESHWWPEYEHHDFEEHEPREASASTPDEDCAGGYYHVSPFRLPRGTVLRPGMHGRGNFDESTGEHSFMTSDREHAEQYRYRLWEQGHPEQHMYEVRPHGPVEADPADEHAVRTRHPVSVEWSTDPDVTESDWFDSHEPREAATQPLQPWYYGTTSHPLPVVREVPREEWPQDLSAWHREAAVQDQSEEVLGHFEASRPLREENGIYWRAHLRGVPFDAEHAWSAPEPNFHDEPAVRGYSAFAHPYHLAQYMPEHFGEDSYRRDAIAFHGRRVGTGPDGEDLVIPEEHPGHGHVIHEQMPWHEFEGRAWDDHPPESEDIPPAPWKRMASAGGASRPGRGEKRCPCCQGAGSHGSDSCEACGREGTVGRSDQVEHCPGEPQPKRRRWRAGSAESGPSGKTWLHGTRTRFSPGDLIGLHHSYAWATLDPEEAHDDWAHGAKGDGRPRVYEVEPTGPSLYGPDDDHYKSGDPMRVVREHLYECGRRECSDDDLPPRTAAMPEPNYDPSVDLPVGRGVWYRAHLKSQPLDEGHARSRPVNARPGDPEVDPGQRGYSAFAHPQHLRDYMDEYGWTGTREADWDDREVVAFHGKQVGRGEDNEPLVIPEANRKCCGNVIHSRMPWEDFEQRLPGAAPLHPAAVPPWKTLYAPDPTPRSKSVRRHYQDETDRVNRDRRQERHQERLRGQQEGRPGVTASIPPAERTESVRHILDNYRPYDFDTWDEVRDNNVWDHPKMRDFVDDVRRNGVLRPIPVDYEQDPPQVRNGHTRLLAAERAGIETVPTRQHHGWLDPDDHGDEDEEPEPKEGPGSLHHETERLRGRQAMTSRDEYGYQHRPLADRPPLHEGGGVPVRDLRAGDDEARRESVSQYRAAQGAPGRHVRVYRAAPARSAGMINTGDWVTLGHGYARDLAEDRNFHDPDESLLGDPKTGPDRFHVYEATVPAHQVRGASDLMEWGYWGEPARGEHSERCGQGECHGRTAALEAPAQPGGGPSAITVEHREMPSGGATYPHMHVLTATHPDGTQAELRYMLSKRNGKGVVDHSFIPGDYAESLGKPLVQEARRLHPGTLVKGLPGIDEDWGQHLPSVSSLHRHLTVKLDPADREYVHDGSVPRAQRAAHLMGLMERGGASMHWASQRGRAAAEKFGDHDFRSPEHTQIALSAAPPSPEHVETDPERISRNGGYAYQAPDWEVPLKEGAQVSVRSVRWRTGDSGWVHHQFKGGHQFTAGRAPGDEGSAALEAEVVAHFGAGAEAPQAPYAPAPQSHDELWQHVQEAHGTRQSADSEKKPGEFLLNALHRRYHNQGTEPHNLHQHEGTGDGQPRARQPQRDPLAGLFTPIPPGEMEEQRRAREPKPERIDDREYSIGDVSRHYDWEGFDPFEISHLVRHPERATFTREDVPVRSLRQEDEHGSLVAPASYQEIADQGEDERQRLGELERGYDQDAPIPPIVVVRHGEHHIIADGSHRAAVHAERGHSHIPAFVTQRTTLPGQHTAALEEGGYRMQHTAPSPEAGHLPLHHYAGGHPADLVRIYRSAPPGTEAIHHGDWISLSADYAHQHGRHATDSARDWPAYTAEVPQRHVHWDENDENEHGYNGPSIPHPDVHDEETGGLHDWHDWHEEHPHGQEAWAGAAVHLPQEQHDEVHDEFGWEPDRASALMDAARHQGALRHAQWRDDLYPARDDAEAHAGRLSAPEGHRLTAFTLHRGDSGKVEDVAVHPYEHGDDDLRRYQNMSMEGHHWDHPAVGDVGRGDRHQAAEPLEASLHVAVSDYHMRHRPGSPEDQSGAPMHDVEDMLPGSYDDPQRYTYGDPVHRESARQLVKARGNAEHPVTIYRALPHPHQEISPGDWVSTSAAYARGHGESNIRNGQWHVIRATVPAGHLWSEGNSISEWGYHGPAVQAERHEGPHLGWNETHHEAALPAAEVVAHFEAPPAAPARKRAAKQREGDERPYGYYTMRYRSEDMGERRPRHFIDARTPEGSVAGRLDWYGTTGWVHHIDVAGEEDDAANGHSLIGDGRDHQGRGLATAMWDWSQEMSPKAKHSKDQTEQGKDWARGLKARERRDPPEGPPGGADSALEATAAAQVAPREGIMGQQPRRFFHGTSGTYSFQPGDLLTPADGRMQHVYYTEHLPSAARYAGYGHPLNERGYQDLNAEARPGHVYEVQPETRDGKRIGRHAEDPYSGVPGNEQAYRTKGRLRVLHEVDRETGEPLGAADGDRHEAARAVVAIEASPREAAMAPLENPHTSGHEWYHGSPHLFGSFHGDAPDSHLQYAEDEADGSHWNTLLGHHFAASHEIAGEFSRGEHSSAPDGTYDDATPQENVVHARLGIRNPRVYASEHDMDQEAYEHEWRAGNHHDAHHDPELLEDDDWTVDDRPATYQFAGHGDRMRGRDEADPVYWHVHRTYHPYATGWLNSHPDKYGIAQRFRQRLTDQGHDGIVYGNEFEKHPGTGDNHHIAAVPFSEHQIDVTQRHRGPDCVAEEHAIRQWPGRGQEPLFDERGEPHEGSGVVAHFEEALPTPRTAAGLNHQLKLFHVQPDPTLHEPGSGRHNPEDPEGHARWRSENDPGYEPDSCEHCGADMNMPREHGEEHQSWLGQQDWYTDWDHEGPGDTIHRGIGMDLPDEVHAVVHDESRPVHERAHALLSHVLRDQPGGNGLGNFWSGHSGVSKVYAEGAARRYGRRNVQTPVMLHAHTPAMEHIETDPDQLQHWGVYSYHLAGNREVPVSHGAPLRVRGISWAPPGHQRDAGTRDEPPRLEDDPAWTHHEVGGEGIRATASGTLSSDHAEEQRAALEVVAHFEEEAPDWTPASLAGWSYNHNIHGIVQARGPQGEEGHYYTDGSALEGHRHPSDAPGPLYHGTDRELAPGEHAEPGHPGNFTDEPLEHVYMTEHPEDDWGGHGKGARGYGRHVYEVRPTGWIGHRSDAQGHNWATPDPVEVLREVPDPRERTAVAVVAHFDELAATEATTGGNPPCHYCGEPLDDSDVADDVSAHEECSDMRWCEPHQEHHDDPSEAEDHNSTYTDWCGHLPFEGGIHRGITIRLPDEAHAAVHDESRPPAERAAVLDRHLRDGGEGQLGVHWTDHEAVARNWGSGEGALFSPAEDRSDPRVTHVVMHAASPDDDHIETDPEALAGRDMLGFDHPRSEREVPLRAGAPVRLTGLSWKRGGEPNTAWRRHDFAAPSVHVAALEVTAGDVNHGDMDEAQMRRHMRERHGFIDSPDDPDWMIEETHRSEHADAPLEHRHPDLESDPDWEEEVGKNLGDKDWLGQHGIEAAMHEDEREDDDEDGEDDDDHDDYYERYEAEQAARQATLPYVSPPPEGELIDHVHHMHGLDARTTDLYHNAKARQRWHDAEHAHRTSMTHQHEQVRGTPGEKLWPAAFQLSEHTDFAGGTRGDWSRVPGNTEKLKPLMPSESALHQPEGLGEGHTAAVEPVGDDSLDWSEIADRHPAIYGDPEVHGDEASEDGNNIADAAAHLYHDRPGHPYDESYGGLNPAYGGGDMRFHPRTVDTDRIDYVRHEPWDPRVKEAAQGYKTAEGRETIPPLILVHRHGVFQVADGHHRGAGAAAAHWPSVRAYVAYSPHEEEPFSDGERGPYHGASTQDRPAPLNYPSGERRRTAFPGFPHAADVGLPGHRTAAIEAAPSVVAHFMDGEEHEVPPWESGRPLLHGTRSILYPGEVLTPGEARRHPAHWSDISEGYVHVTPHGDEAQYWAEYADVGPTHERMRELGRDREADYSRGQNQGHAYPPRVYEVKPTGPVEPDPHGEGSSYRTAHPVHILREVRQLACGGDESCGGESAHWPGHPHYEALAEQAREDEEEHREREEAAPEEDEPEEHEHPELPAPSASHPDDESATAEAGAMESHLRQAHGYTGEDIGTVTGRVSNVRGRRNSLNAAHKGDHASEGFEHWEQHPHPPLTLGRRPDGGPVTPMADALQTSMAEHRWRKSREAAALPATRPDKGVGGRGAAWDEYEEDEDPDRYVHCDQGHDHWGALGAAGLLIRHHDDDGQVRYLLQKRSPHVQHGNTWSTPGGAIGHGESPEDAAAREATEELGDLPHDLAHHHTVTDDHGNWAYHTVVMDSPRRFEPHGGDPDSDWESSGHRWVTPREMRELPLHPGFAASWEGVRKSGALDDEGAARGAREERGDRWHEFGNRYTEDLHRGIYALLPGELHDYVHDESAPREDRARALQEHFSSGGLGMHWTPHIDIAHRSIANAADDPDRYHQEAWGDADFRPDFSRGGTDIMFHGTTGERNRLRNPDALNEHEVGRGFSPDEDEFPMRPGSPVRLNGISWRPHDESHQMEPYEHVDFPRPVRHTSSRVSPGKTKGELVIASHIADQVAIPAAPTRATAFTLSAWEPESAEDFERLVRDFPAFFLALHQGLEALASRMDEQPVTEEVPAIFRRMAAACLTAAEDASRLVPPLDGDSPEGTWQGPRAIEPPKG